MCDIDFTDTTNSDPAAAVFGTASTTLVDFEDDTDTQPDVRPARTPKTPLVVEVSAKASIQIDTVLTADNIEAARNLGRLMEKTRAGNFESLTKRSVACPVVTIPRAQRVIVRGNVALFFTVDAKRVEVTDPVQITVQGVVILASSQPTVFGYGSR